MVPADRQLTKQERYTQVSRGQVNGWYLAFLDDLSELVKDLGVDEALLPDHSIILVLAVVGISHLHTSDIFTPLPKCDFCSRTEHTEDGSFHTWHNMIRFPTFTLKVNKLACPSGLNSNSKNSWPAENCQLN